MDISNISSIKNIAFGQGAFSQLKSIILERQSFQEKKNLSRNFVIYIDDFFESNEAMINPLKSIENTEIHYIDSSKEPTTALINDLRDRHLSQNEIPGGLIAIGGGVTLDIVKALSNLLNNKGNAEDYQGWDLVKNKGVYKIGVPTLSGTGAESSRTCVLINEKTGLKLGMNSDFTLFDELVLDPDLTRSVPKDIFFYTVTDAYFHCVEPLSGMLRNDFADSYAKMGKSLCEEIFKLDDIRSNEGRTKAMLASYFGGIAIANSMTALVHPFSAGLSVVLQVPHTLANCLVMLAMEEYYPNEHRIISDAIERHGIEVPKGICKDLDNEQYDKLYDSSIIHEKPLSNGLGDDFKSILTKEKVIEIFNRI